MSNPIPPRSTWRRQRRRSLQHPVAPPMRIFARPTHSGAIMRGTKRLPFAEAKDYAPKYVRPLRSRVQVLARVGIQRGIAAAKALDVQNVVAAKAAQETARKQWLAERPRREAARAQRRQLAVAR